MCSVASAKGKRRQTSVSKDIDPTPSVKNTARSCATMYSPRGYLLSKTFKAVGFQPDRTGWKPILPSCRIAHGDLAGVRGRPRRLRPLDEGQVGGLGRTAVALEPA